MTRAPSIERALDGALIRVGTENAAKLAAVRSALAPFASDPDALRIEPARVESAVPEQPVGWREITDGACHRARAALALGECALAVGIEDGLVQLTDEVGASANLPASLGRQASAYFNVGCAWVTDGEREGRGYSSGFAYPPGCLGPAVEEASPIGDLFDDLWRAHQPASAVEAQEGPSGRSGGNIGRLTDARLERADYGSHAVVCALVRFLHTDLYD